MKWTDNVQHAVFTGVSGTCCTRYTWCVVLSVPLAWINC